ncbi:Scr1 family TA system antitoxin-like transcriptional regulator [Nocardia sp. NPDC127606]|uniref:Scr1 family TA system antitoxin-like transcriptional regulator n=1 Tax=Nocardia sp. NPDC127606 TaxID=3345406 RepID=UPI0036254EF2
MSTLDDLCQCNLARIERAYHPDLVPDPLRTPGYLRAYIVAEGHAIGVDNPDIEETLADYLEEQDPLNFPGSRYHWLIGEAALLRTVGSAEVMTEQIHALLAATTKENIEIGIIPLDARFVTPIRNFRIWGPEGEAVFVDTEEFLEVSVSRRSGDAGHADRSFRLLVTQAVYGNDARTILTRALSTHTTD